MNKKIKDIGNNTNKFQYKPKPLSINIEGIESRRLNKELFPFFNKNSGPILKTKWGETYTVDVQTANSIPEQ